MQQTYQIRADGINSVLAFLFDVCIRVLYWFCTGSWAINSSIDQVFMFLLSVAVHHHPAFSGLSWQAILLFVP